jgi:hypothetical protein
MATSPCYPGYLRDLRELLRETRRADFPADDPHGRFAKDQRALLLRGRRSGVPMKTRGTEGAFPAKYGWHHSLHIGDVMRAIL